MSGRLSGETMGAAMNHQDVLLPGERPESEEPEDAELWIGVYAELIEVKDSLLATMLDQMKKLTEQARDELARVDEAIIRDQSARFRRRHAFWEARLKQLRADDVGRVRG
jgi:hypothetical protein